MTESLIQDSRLYPPDPERASRTNCGGIEAFEAMLRKSREDPEGFWDSVARELEWIKPWDKPGARMLLHA